jgi:hypothetical protein
MTSEEAKEAAERWVVDSHGPEFAIVPGPLIEDEWFFVFSYAKRDLETGDLLGLLGAGPTVLDKRDGRIFSYGSGSGMGSIEAFLQEHRTRAERELVIRQSFPDYDMGKPYRVLIRKIHKKRRLLMLLESFALLYVIPEIETNTIWRVPKRYDKRLLRKRLSEPVPIEFGCYGCAGTVDNLFQLVGCCEISIQEYHHNKKTNDPSSVKPEDLAPEW